jgi:MazG family protein
MELIARLRGPQGCPWDRKQTGLSAAPYLLEEAYEAVDAIESKDPASICAELGDVLFQVAFQAQIAAEAGHFDLARVIEQVRDKMTQRHPHVFGAQKLENADQVLELWGEIKGRERARAGEGLMQSLPLNAPALVRAQRLGKRAARVGFDWENSREVWAKAQEETDELSQAANQKQAEAELGDLLFAWAQWARHSGINAETALRAANTRFLRRFNWMEDCARKEGQGLDGMSPEDLDRLWERAKTVERESED